MSDWALLTVILGLGVVLLVVVSLSVKGSRKPLQPDAQGWIQLTSTLADRTFGVITICFALVWLTISIYIIISGEMPEERPAQLFILLMFVMGALFAKYFFFGYCAMIRFSEEKFEYAAFWKRISVYWNEVEQIKISANGPVVLTVEGKAPVSNLRRGFYQLLEAARRNGVHVQDNKYLK